MNLQAAHYNMVMLIYGERARTANSEAAFSMQPEPLKSGPERQTYHTVCRSFCVDGGET